MKIIPLLFALSVVAVPGVALAETSFVHGAGALATFEHISDDGCVHTVGEIVLVQATRGGDLADGLYITGSQEDVCTGAGNGFASFTEGNFLVFPLVVARATRTVVAPSYSSGADITFEINLTWFGRGAISPTLDHFRDEGGASVSYNASRGAATIGFVKADGVVMPITSARLIHQASGSISY